MSRQEYPPEFDMDPVTDCFNCAKKLDVGVLDCFCSTDCENSYIKRQSEDANSYAAQMEEEKKLGIQYQALKWSYDRQDGGKYDF